MERIANALSDVNISLYDSHGIVRGVFEVLEELADVWESLDIEEQRYIKEAIEETSEVNLNSDAFNLKTE